MEASTNTLKVLSELAPRIPIIVLAYNNDAELAGTAICHGSKGYIPVTMGFEITIEAVRFVLAKSNKVIAYDLNMCESTVKVHVRNIMKKLNAKNRTDVAIKAQSVLSTFPRTNTCIELST